MVAMAQPRRLRSILFFFARCFHLGGFLRPSSGGLLVQLTSPFKRLLMDFEKLVSFTGDAAGLRFVVGLLVHDLSIHGFSASGERNSGFSSRVPERKLLVC